MRVLSKRKIMVQPREFIRAGTYAGRRSRNARPRRCKTSGTQKLRAVVKKTIRDSYGKSPVRTEETWAAVADPFHPPERLKQPAGKEEQQQRENQPWKCACN